VTRRIEDLGTNERLKEKSKSFLCYSLALDESNDVSGATQLLIFIRGTDDIFSVYEELPSV
jgi:hypothetical protein